MVAAFLLGLAAGALFVGFLYAAGLLFDHGAAAISIFAVASLYPAYAIGEGFSDFLLHLAILAGFFATAVVGYLVMPRLIALAILSHAVLDLAFIVSAGETTPRWVGFCCGFDILVGGVFFGTLKARE